MCKIGFDKAENEPNRSLEVIYSIFLQLGPYWRDIGELDPVFQGAQFLTSEEGRPEYAGTAGVLVTDVEAGSPAAVRGLRPGDVITHGCKRTLVQAESRLVMAIGLEDVVVVETKDSTLVAHKSRSQDVKTVVDQLKAQEREETALHREVFRPWGSYDSLESADGFQVKRLVVKPGAILSLQNMHTARSTGSACAARRASPKTTRNSIWWSRPCPSTSSPT